MIVNRMKTAVDNIKSGLNVVWNRVNELKLPDEYAENISFGTGSEQYLYLEWKMIRIIAFVNKKFYRRKNNYIAGEKMF